MALEDFDFIKKDPEKLEHIGRHLDGSHTAGSHFVQGAFENAEELIEFALKHIRDYNGERMEVELDLDRIIGHDSLIPLVEVPEGTIKTQEPRGQSGYMVNVVRGVDKRPTKHMVIVAGPLEDKRKHGFYTIFPGINAPPVPVTDEKLATWGLTGKALENAKRLNVESMGFWEKYALVDDRIR